MIVRNKTITLVNDAGNCTVATNSRRTIASLTEATGTITFIVDSSKCVIGDELVLIVTQGIDGDPLVLDFDTPDFAFSSCRTVGGEDSQMIFNVNENIRWVGHFFFDGSRYVNTAEDC